jgi:tRNA(fMet)-specific endonuclease VapC
LARLILDTGVVIAGARGRLELAGIGDVDDVALPAVVVAEFLAGTLLDNELERAATQRAYLDAVLVVLPVHEYDRDVAAHHADLLAHARRVGAKRGAHDMIVAATARATDRTVLTTDKSARFDDLPGVTSRVTDG